MKKNIRSDFQSRQYMLSENYELYYYSDLHFKNVKIHSHNYYEFYFFLKGDVEMLLDGEAHPLTEGDIIVVPPGILHQARILDPEKPYSRIVFWLSRENYEACISKKKLLVVDHAGHGSSVFENTKLYEDTEKAFLEEALG